MNLVGVSGHKFGMLEVQSYDCDMSDCYLPEWPQKTRHSWCNIFKSFYNLSPVLDTDGPDSILGNCQGLIELAEELQSVDTVSRAITTALLTFDQQLYRLISLDPASWAKLAVRLQAGPIFKESVIHLVGKWGYLDVKERNSLPTNIRNLCIEKVQDLIAIKEAVELKIVNKLPRPRSDSTCHRESRNVFGWMALTFYQQWLCESFAANRNHHAPDGGASFYRAIAAGGDAYLNKLDRDIFQAHASLESNPESGKGLKELEKDLNELKKGMKGCVAELLVNEAKFSSTIHGALPYLTCCKVSEEEMPQLEVTPAEMGLQFRGVGSTINTDLLNTNNNNHQQQFLPGESMMDCNGVSAARSLNRFANHYLMDPALQNHNSNSCTLFNPFTNAFNQQHTDPLLSWNNTVTSFPNAVSHFGTATPAISPIQPIPFTELPNNDVYHRQPQIQNQAQFDPSAELGANLDMDFLNESFPPEGDAFMQHSDDGSMAFL